MLTWFPVIGVATVLPALVLPPGPQQGITRKKGGEKMTGIVFDEVAVDALRGVFPDIN
jgi:hypothetical protein